MNDFMSFGLPDTILDSLKHINFTTPTPIQVKAIPVAMDGNDILGSAQTGTGKTAAYCIPMIAYLLANKYASTLILTPTRELASQVLGAIKKIMPKNSKIKSALLIGGDSMSRQLFDLSQKPKIIVGTPGRVNDHLLRRSLNLEKTSFFVLDEVDRMLDMGFSIQLEKIAHYLPKKRQTLMFSATVSGEIEQIAKTYLNNEVRISIGQSTKPVQNVKQEAMKVTEQEKYKILLDFLDKIESSAIVFVKTKILAEKLSDALQENGYKSDVIHGDLRQRNRDRVIRAFRTLKSNILVATDIAARGLDIPHIECVINYDLPQCPEDYIHRIGRTGRAGADGFAVSFVTSSDFIKWRNICKLIDPTFQSELSQMIKNDRKPNKFKSFKNKKSNNYDNKKFNGDNKFTKHNGDNKFTKYNGDNKFNKKNNFSKRTRAA